MRSRRPSSFSACSRTCSGMPASAIFARYSSTTDASSSPSSLRIDSICLRRKYSRCCLLGAGLDVLADPLAHLQLGQALALEAQGQLEALGDVERLEQLDLLLEGEVGGVAARVGQRAGLGDRAHERSHAAVVAAQLEDLLDHGAVLALELAGAAVDGLVVGGSSTSTRRRPVGSVLGGAGDAAVEAVQRDGLDAAGQADVVGDLGDGADGRELGLVPGHEQHALLVGDVDGERHGHVGEDDGVVERDQEEAGHEVSGSYFTW